jgi:hypothetical protein
MPKQIIFPKLTSTITRYKRQGERGEKSQFVKDGQEEITYEVSVDTDRLEIMAHTATKNKNWRSHDGALHVQVLATRKLP